MENKVIRIQGSLELAGPVLFLLGAFIGNWLLIITGGVVMLLLDFIEISMGVLNPLFPIIFAIALGITIEPWWYGVFWSLGIFHILNIFTAIKKIKLGAKVIGH